MDKMKKVGERRKNAALGKMKRLQGAEYHAIKEELIPIAYSITKAGNICVYYKGGFKHYLNDDEKSTFQPNGLVERYKQ